MKGLLRRIDRLTAEWWMVLIFSAGLVMLSVATQFLQRPDMLLYDLAQRMSPNQPHPHILLVSIDDRSLNELGAWPWPRAQQAELLSALEKGRPHGVLYDVLLLEPRDTAGDRDLGLAIRAGSPKYLPVEFMIPGRNGAQFELAEPVAPFRNAAAGLGQANLLPDSDGIVRRAYLEYASGSMHWPHLVSLLSGVVQTAPSTPYSETKSILEARHPAMIAFAGPQGTFPSVSAASLLRGEVPQEALAGKLVLVGVTATGIGDAYSTPVTNDRTLMPGLEVQANLLNSLLTKRVITPIAGPLPYVFAVMPMLVMMVGLRILRPQWTIWFLAGLIVASLAASLALLANGLWLGCASALLGLLLVYPLWNWRRLATVSAYFTRELENLEAETGHINYDNPAVGRVDVVDRQMALLQSAAERERDLRRERDEVMQLLSHDMRAPQVSIMTLIARETPAKIDPSLARFIRDYSEKTLHLADGFVQLSRAQSLRFDPQVLDICDVSQEAVDAIWPQASSKEITVKTRYPDNEVLMKGEPSLLMRMLVNLMDNAIRFSQSGQTVQVAIARAEKSDTAFHTITITDMGEGIAPQRLERVFERFQTSGKIGNSGGVGLGLAFVHTTVTRHGGTITCESKEGQGTSFIILLPAYFEADQSAL